MDSSDSRETPRRMLSVDRWLGPRHGTVRANARIDFLAAVLFGVFGGLTIPFIPVMARRMGAAPLEISLVVAAQALAMLLSLFWVNVAHRADPVRLVVWTQSIGRSLLLFMPFVSTPRVYVVVVFLYHAIASAAPLGYAQVMRAVYPDDVRGRVMGLVRIGMAAAWIVASLVGGRIMQTVRFQTVFAIAALFGLAGGFVFRWMRVEGPRESAERFALSGTWRTLRAHGQFRLFLAAFFVFGFGAWLMGPAIPILLVDELHATNFQNADVTAPSSPTWKFVACRSAIPILLVDELHATNFQVGLLGAVTSAFWLVAFYQWGRLIDRQTAPGALVFTFLIGALTPLIYLISFNPWMVLASGVTDGFTSAGIDLGWLTALLQFAPTGYVAHYVAIFNTLVGVRGSTAPFLAGVLIPRIGVRAVFGIAIGCTLAGAWLMRRAAVRATSVPTSAR